MKITDVKTHLPVGLLRITTDADVEGWCLGVPAQPEEALRDPVNDLEAFNTDYMQFYAQLVYNIMFMDKKFHTLRKINEMAFQTDAEDDLSVLQLSSTDLLFPC